MINLFFRCAFVFFAVGALSISLLAQETDKQKLDRLLNQTQLGKTAKERIQAWQELADLRPNEGGVYFGMAKEYFDGKDFRKASSSIDKALQLGLDNNLSMIDAHRLRALSNEKMGNLDPAVSDAFKMIQLIGSKPGYDAGLRLDDAYMILIRAYKAIGDHEKVVSFGMKAIEVDNMVLFEEAPIVTESFRQLSKNSPAGKPVAGFDLKAMLNDAETKYAANVGLYYTKISPEAGNAISKVIALLGDDNRDVAAWYIKRARLYLPKGDAYEAQLLLGRVIELYPDIAEAYILRARTFNIFDEEDQELILLHYKRALEIEPNNASAFYHRGEFFMQIKLYDRSIADFGNALKIDPAYKVVWFRRALIFKDYKKDLQSALRDLTEYIKLEADNMSAYRDRAEVYRALGREAEAIADEKKAESLKK